LEQFALVVFEVFGKRKEFCEIVNGHAICFRKDKVIGSLIVFTEKVVVYKFCILQLS